MLKSVLTTLVIITLTMLALNNENTTKSPEDIMDTVVIVNSSSGVVVASDEDKTLVLTAYHVIKESAESEPAEDIYVMFLYNTDGIAFLDKYKVDDFIFDEESDLALLEIHPERILDFTRIAEKDPGLGEDIFIGSNPNFRYRSLKKGIISSKARYLGYNMVWEVSGGIVFGSSGGGAFTMDGRLFGIVRSVEPLKTSCWEEEDEEGNNHQVCQYVPIYHMGYISPPQRIRSFILSGKYSEDFNYLR